MENKKVKITVQTTVKSAIEDVWKIWITPDDIVQWNTASDDWHTTKAENDLKAGGKFSYRMEAKDGSFGFDFEGIYDNVRTCELIEYTLGDGRQSRIAFVQQGDEISISQTFDAETENPIELQKNGWQEIMNNFKKYTETLKISKMSKSHIYPGAHTLNVYLNITGCNDAIEFYKKAFGAIEKFRLLMPDGKIAHAEIVIEGSLLMMADENPDWGTKSPQTLGGNPVTIGLYVADADKSFQKAVDEGATVIMPLKDEFYGDRVGQVLDPFGYKWMITTHMEDVSGEEMQIRMDKMFSGQ